jgi:hypothetical protein
LTFDQLLRMDALAGEDGEARHAARHRVVEGIADHELAGRLASRWVRWADTFGLTRPRDLDDPRAVLLHRYACVRRAASAQDPALAKLVLPVFDAGLAIAAAGLDTAGLSDYELLIAPWRSVCLPSRFTTTSAFGRHTQPALRVLRFAVGMSADVLDRMSRERDLIVDGGWEAADKTVLTESIACGYPFRARCLYWEAVPVAEEAAGQTPVARSLVEALWGAAATQAFAGMLPSEATEVLARPWRRAGLTLPG